MRYVTFRWNLLKLFNKSVHNIHNHKVLIKNFDEFDNNFKYLPLSYDIINLFVSFLPFRWNLNPCCLMIELLSNPLCQTANQNASP